MCIRDSFACVTRRSMVLLAGIFATRTPHRPNPIGLSLCRSTGPSVLQCSTPIFSHDLTSRFTSSSSVVRGSFRDRVLISLSRVNGDGFQGRVGLPWTVVMSCLFDRRLDNVEGSVVHLSGVDIIQVPSGPRSIIAKDLGPDLCSYELELESLDGTPILDIKPYIPYCDHHRHSVLSLVFSHPHQHDNSSAKMTTVGRESQEDASRVRVPEWILSPPVRPRTPEASHIRNEPAPTCLFAHMHAFSRCKVCESQICPSIRTLLSLGKSCRLAVFSRAMRRSPDIASTNT
eukprot:1866405-Rhodomonas_salina.7